MRTIAGVTVTFVVLLLGILTNRGTLAGQEGDAVQLHIGHAMDSFQGTPNQQGLLPTALAEAKIAAEHAGLGVKAADKLDAMKLHAGHVIHAVDPSVEIKGPGLGYGVKKAAAGVAQHVELAAKGATASVKLHATHVSASANNVVKRADEIVALAQKIRAASNAAEAAKLIHELNALAEQLTAGLDANSDSRVTWEVGEGGLQQAQQHLELMKKASTLPVFGGTRRKEEGD